ncbi:MAG: hypothetical protein ACRDGS_04210, partial [Chloroflexota bacterium]
TDSSGATSYTYDSLNQLTSETIPNQGTIACPSPNTGITAPVCYAYDAAGNLLTMTDRSGATSYTYDILDQLTSETIPNQGTIACPSPNTGITATVCYAYDAAGNLIAKTDAGGTVSYGYDATGQVTSVTDRQGKSYTVGYDQDGNRTSIGFPNGVSQGMTYDAAGQLTRIAGTKGSRTLTSSGYSYTNPSTNRVTALPYSATNTAGATTTYSYDATNALTQAIQKSSGGATLNSYGYGYDAAGNLTSKSTNGTSTTFSYNAVTELTSASGGMNRTYTYDGNGDRISSSDGTAITVNAGGQVTGITPPGGSSIPYRYTGTGEQQRIGNGSTGYQYDGTGLSKQTDSTGDTYFTSLPDGTALSETITSGSNAGTYYYLSDGQGSAAALTDSNGTVRDSYTYDPMGNTTSSGSVPNPFTYQGWAFDSKTGYYYTGSGYYDPATGQTIGCHDKGMYDPGEDLCGKDEPAECGGTCSTMPAYSPRRKPQDEDPGLNLGAVTPDEGGGGEGTRGAGTPLEFPNLQEEYDKHVLIRFEYHRHIGEAEYLKKARALFSAPLGHGVYQFRGINGSYYRYNKNTREFGIRTAGYGIVTFFRPDTGYNYYLGKKREEMEAFP